ncbi:MAG: amino acid ABC transporter permease [Advenella sp.]
MTDYIALIDTYFLYILRGAIITVELTVLALLLSVVIGLTVTFTYMSRVIWLKTIATVYIELVRATPALLQLFIVYYGLTNIGIRFDAFTAAVLTLGFIGGAYSAEIFRAGIEAIDFGQIEASRSLGMTAIQAMKRIVLPQAFVITLPPLTNFVIAMIKDTSLALTISVPEIMYRSYDAATQSYRSLAVYMMAGVIYLAICIPLSRLAKRLERKGDAS